MSGVPLFPQAPQGLNGLPDWARNLITTLTNNAKVLEARLVELERRLSQLENS